MDEVLKHLHETQGFNKAALGDEVFTDTESFSDDDDDSLFSSQDSTLDEFQIDQETDRLEHFIRALPSCYLLTIESDHGFYCPCGRKMKHWRSLVGCDYINDRVCPNENVFSDRASLVAHLNEKERHDRYHEYILLYLTNLSFA